MNVSLENLSDESRIALVEDVRAILAEADSDIAARKPVCQASGRCCKFEQYGHRLYVTHAELIHFAETFSRRSEESATESDAGGASAATRSPGTVRTVSLHQFFAADKQEGCPYQVGGLCTAREARPLGCRIYFCDEHAQHWQNTVYEKYHKKLTTLHQAHGLNYSYVEWRVGLRMLMEGSGT